MSKPAIPKIEITPPAARIDEAVHIRLTHFAANTEVTLYAEMPDDLGQKWSSHATFMTDPNGAIDVATQAPTSGSYSDVNQMGIIWSMSADQPGASFVQTTVTPVEVQFRADVSGQTLATATLERIRLAAGVTRVEVRDNGLFATFFIPEGDGPHPAIILVSGSGGGLSEWRGALYAAHGIATLSLAYFAYESLPKGLVEIPLEYFETAIAWLQSHPKINPERLAITGNSRGGELSLLLGATFSQFKAVVAYVPSGVIWAGFSAEGDGDKSSWTYQGKSLPYMPYVEDTTILETQAALAQNNEPIPLTPGFVKALENKTAVEASFIPVEKTNGAILLISGEQDAMWPGTTMANAVVQRLQQYDFAYPYQHLSYPDAGHMIIAPYIPTTITYSRHPVDGNLYAYGGTSAGYAFADSDSWSNVLKFLAENL